MKRIIKTYNTKFWIFLWVLCYLSIFLSIYIYTNNLNTQYFKPIIKQKVNFEIYPNTNYDELINELKKKFNVTDNLFFDSYINKKNIINFKPGRYVLDTLFSFNDIINEIRVPDNRKKAHVSLTFNASNNFDLLVSNYLRSFPIEKNKNFTNSEKTIDSIDVLNAIYKYDYSNYIDISIDSNLIRALYIPNTYQYHWDFSINEFINTTLYNYDQFWSSKDRINKLNDLNSKWDVNFNPIDVSILASIVYKEAKFEEEYEKIAGLYLNRLDINMKLEADPTVNYAFQQKNGFDTTLNRVYKKHFKIDSKYNTYKYKGLPPAPICIPSKQAIEAVLNAQKHEYLFMCAKVEIDEFNKYIYFPGLHSFSKSYKNHKKYAKDYHYALNKIRDNKIYKICYDDINNCFD